MSADCAICSRPDVTTTVAGGSPEALARVAKATASSRSRHQRADPLPRQGCVTGQGGVRAVQPRALRHRRRRSRGIHLLPAWMARPSALPIAICRCGCGRHWRSRTASTRLHVKFHKISAAVREPILSAGQVDAVAGFTYLSAVNLRDRGVPGGDLVVLRYADYGCEAYGFAVIVNPAFAAARPDAVKGIHPRIDRRHQRDRQGAGTCGGRGHEPHRERRPRS